MSYVIVSGAPNAKFYFTGIKKGKCIEWTSDGMGRLARKVERVPVKDTGKEKGLQIVGNYATDIKKAKLFKTREAAEKQIAEYSVLRYCTVEEAVC